MRHHTTGPIGRVSPLAPVGKIDPHRRDAPAQAIFAQVRQFYLCRLRAMAKASKRDGALDGRGPE